MLAFRSLPWLNFKVFTPAVSEVLGKAALEADATRHEVINPEHLFVSILASGKGVTAKVLGKVAQQTQAVRKIISRGSAVENKPQQTRKPYRGVEKKLSRPTKVVLRTAIKKAKTLGHYAVGTDHVMLALLEKRDGKMETVLEQFQLNGRQCYMEIEQALK
jgi:ATP-dependent Clp protease ATP-binding subunit ClpC